MCQNESIETEIKALSHVILIIATSALRRHSPDVGTRRVDDVLPSSSRPVVVVIVQRTRTEDAAAILSALRNATCVSRLMRLKRHNDYVQLLTITRTAKTVITCH